MKKMESAIYCPVCGGLVSVVMAEVISLFYETFGMSGTTHFGGEGECACGKKIMATLHISAFDGEEA